MNAEFSSKVFSERLKSARLKADLTKKGLADKSGISPLSISGYEAATKKPNLSTTYVLARTLNVSVDWLCGLTEGNEQEASEPTTRDYLLFATKLIDAVTDDSFLKIAEDHLISGTPIYDFIIDYLKFKSMLKDWRTNIDTIEATRTHLFQNYESYSIESLTTVY